MAVDGYSGVMRQIAQKFNRMVELNEALTNEIMRVERVVRREGRMTETASLRGVTGGWSHVVSSVNSLISAELTLTITAEFNAPVTRVWELWENPRLLERWWGPPTYPATF